MPEKHFTHDTKSSDIALNYSIQALKTTNNCFPPTLVICLPSFKLHSANHEPMSVRQSLPVKIRHREVTRRETLPWTLQAENLAVFSVHVKKLSTPTGSEYQPVARYLLSKVSSTAVLASARTSSVPSSPPLPPSQFLKPASAGGRRVSTLGFCVHTDFQPIEVSCSRKQVSELRSLIRCRWFIVTELWCELGHFNLREQAESRLFWTGFFLVTCWTFSSLGILFVIFAKNDSIFQVHISCRIFFVPSHVTT